MIKLITNGHFYYDKGFNNGIKAIIVEDGIIKKLIRAQETVPADLHTIDLEGGYAYPGFIDTHTHSFEGGLYANGVDLYDCRSISEVLDKIKAGILALGQEDTLFCWRLDENKLAESRFPTIKELDDISRCKYIVIRRIDGHSCILSSAARAQVPELADYSEEVCRAAANDRAVYWFHENICEETIIKAYHTAAQIAIKGGFTSIHTMIGDGKNSISHYPLIDRMISSFPIEYILYPQSFNIKAALEAGATRIGGCILADGSIGSYTAALTSPYFDDVHSKGELYYDDQYWQEFVREAHQNKLQVAVHCLGDKAIAQINTAYKTAQHNDPQDLRHELIHCEITPDALISEIKASGAVPVMQPAFDRYWGGDHGFYARRLGIERSRIMNRFKTLTDNAIRITGSSDWYITELDALMGLEAAINHHNPDERLSVPQAIDIYTLNAAWLSHDENRLGKIEIGYQADLTVLNQELTAVTDFNLVKPKIVLKKAVIVS